MSGTIAITGVPTTPSSDGAVPLRRELRDLQENYPDQFNLLILGLKSLEGQDDTNLASYYQIAGIHGMPYKPWDGVDSNTDWQSTSGFGGYCTHSSILFLTWHRPYLALYEQSLYEAVKNVAGQFPAGALRDKYVAAAEGFRAPYFDWARQPPRGTSAFPTVLRSPTIQVVDVDGQAKSMANPLYHFRFRPVTPPPEDFTSQWSRYPTTVRYPNWAGRSQDWRVGPILANELASLRSNVGLLLLSYNNYDAFSFNRWDPSTNPGEFGSLEDVHNEIHDRTGGGGHMSSLEVSAFDPLFWLHHINVDRLYAIWQDLNPDSFMSARRAPYSTFNAEGGEWQSQDTPLKPFWDKSGRDFWTSAQIKDTLTFGYAYPETQKWQFPNQQTYQWALRQAVAGLYGTNVFSNFVANIAQRRTEHDVAVVAMAGEAKEQEGDGAPAEHSAPPRAIPPALALAAQNFLAAAVTPGQPGGQGTKEEAVSLSSSQPAGQGTKEEAVSPSSSQPAGQGTKEEEGGPIPATLRYLAPNNTYTEWILNARAQKHGLGQTYRLLVFLGPFDESDPGSWDMEFNCVGRVSVLGRSANTTQCAKCRADGEAELLVSGTVPLTSALLQDIVEGDGGLSSLRPEEVVPHLRERLKWKATLFDGTEKDPEEVPGLKVSVASTEVRIGEDGLPVYSGEYTVWPEVTDGKPAGLRQGEHV